LWQTPCDNLLGLRHHTPDDFCGWQDGINETGILADQKRGLLSIPRLTRRQEGLRGLAGVLPQGPLTASPALDEAIT
jgi:hypothetical protein